MSPRSSRAVSGTRPTEWEVSFADYPRSTRGIPVIPRRVARTGSGKVFWRPRTRSLELRRELASFGAAELASFGALPIFPMASFGAFPRLPRARLARTGRGFVRGKPASGDRSPGSVGFVRGARRHRPAMIPEQKTAKLVLASFGETGCGSVLALRLSPSGPDPLGLRGLLASFGAGQLAAFGAGALASFGAQPLSPATGHRVRRGSLRRSGFDPDCQRTAGARSPTFIIALPRPDVLQFPRRTTGFPATLRTSGPGPAEIEMVARPDLTYNHGVMIRSGCAQIT
jgi:hypothetical protein